MKAVRITYDPVGDILYITFGQPTGATGYQLSDQVLLRIDPDSREAAGLTILNYSVHAQSGQDMPLPGLAEDPEGKPHLMTILLSPPVLHFLQVIEDSHGGAKATSLSPSLPEAVLA